MTFRPSFRYPLKRENIASVRNNLTKKEYLTIKSYKKIETSEARTPTGKQRNEEATGLIL